MEKNKKALQYHSIFIHWGCQWTSDGLKPYPSTLNTCTGPHTPVCDKTIVNLLRFDHVKAFLMRVDRETWQSYISYALNANVAVILWIPREDTASTGCTMLSYEDRAQSTEGSSLEIIPYWYNFIKWKQLLLAKTILINVQLRSTQKTIL